MANRKPGTRKTGDRRKGTPNKKTPATTKRKRGRSVGRPTAYRKEFAEQAYKLCLLGAIDKELADFFGVSEKTINTWKSKHPEFLQSITRGKMIADATVAGKLYERACGYSHPEDKIFQYEGDPVIVPTTRHYPPDTQAASLWLRNRQPDKWRDKVSLEHSAPDGGPMRFENMTDEQLQAEINRLLAEAGIVPQEKMNKDVTRQCVRSALGSRRRGGEVGDGRRSHPRKAS